jgi:hypothetical protein
MTVRLRTAIACLPLLCAAVALAQDPALPTAAARLATTLPPAWSGVTGKPPVLENVTTPFKHGSATVTYQGPRASTEPFIVTLSVVDEGAYNASMYAYTANYMKEDIKSSSQHSVKLANGRRALVTDSARGSMDIVTFVANRFIVRASCINSTEAQCIEAFSRFNWKAIEALKP